jgi:sugar (pentulose or hexulose) kinase
LVCLGDRGPIGRAIAWSDGRADEWATRRLDAEPSLRADLYRQTGMPIDGRYLAPMFAFHHGPEGSAPGRADIRHILSAKDFLCFALTGRRVTDPSTASGYGLYAIADGRWDTKLGAFWGIDTGLLPEVERPDAIAGGLNPAGARLLGLPEGVPVTVGAADSVCGALAMAGLRDDTVSLVMGSSTIVIAAVPRLLLDRERRYLLTPHARSGWFAREMDILSTGSGFRWLCRLLGRTEEQVEALALSAPAGANGISFSPYLAGGEQGALWDPSLRGVIHGLGLHQDGADVARAYLEGVFFEIKRCIEVLEADGASEIRNVVLSGGVTGNPGLMRMLADVLGRSIGAYPHRSPAAIGAAMLTSDGDTPLAAGAMAAPGAAAACYGAFYERYLGLYPRIARATPSPAGI